MARSTALLIAVAAFGLVAGVGVFLIQSGQFQGKPELERALFLEPPRAVSWQTLISHDNGDFTPQALKGHWTIMYIGYRSCPDVCPVTMAVLGEAATRLRDSGLDPEKTPEFVFLSVDPRRDTPTVLAEYVTYFGENFVGVTGQPDQLKAVAMQMGALFEVPETPESEDYDVAHSNSVYAFNPEGRLQAIMRDPHDPQVMVHNIRRLID